MWPPGQMIRTMSHPIRLPIIGGHESFFTYSLSIYMSRMNLLSILCICQEFSGVLGPHAPAPVRHSHETHTNAETLRILFRSVQQMSLQMNAQLNYAWIIYQLITTHTKLSDDMMENVKLWRAFPSPLFIYRYCRLCSLTLLIGYILKTKKLKQNR